MSLPNTSQFSVILSLFLSAAVFAAGFDVEADDETGVSDETLPRAHDMLSESRQAACHGQPLVIMFGSSTCPYCSVVRSLYITPLMNDERYPGIVSREIDIDSSQAVRDFSGKRLTMSELAARSGVTLVPQVVIFGPDGKQVGKSLIGISNEDFYGYYLHQAIVAGVDKVQKLSEEKSPSGAPSASPGVYACD